MFSGSKHQEIAKLGLKRIMVKSSKVSKPAIQGIVGGVFHPLCKIRSRHPRELKITGLIAHIMFYKICKFERSAITNDVIKTSLPKTMAKLGPRRNQANYISFKRY